MHVQSHFEETRIDVMHALMRAHPLATLVVMGRDGLEANHLPLELLSGPAPYGTLRGHLGRTHSLWSQFQAEAEALVVFQATHGYISPSWYPSKAQTGKGVPTWNFAVVHAYGRLRVIDEYDFVRANVEALTSTHESGRTEPWAISHAPADYIDKMLRAIIGLEITITRVQAKFKLSQNRSAEDRAGVIEGLEAQGKPATLNLASFMRER